jgi:hypothetical protein
VKRSATAGDEYMNKSPPPIQAALAAALLNFRNCLVFIMSPLQGFKIREGTIRRFRCATPPVIHHVTASAARNELINKVKTKIPMIYYKFCCAQELIYGRRERSDSVVTA